MINISSCLKTRSEIVTLKKLNNNQVAICTKFHGAKIFSLEHCDEILKITYNSLSSSSLCAAFSPNGEFMVFNENSYIHILHIPSKIILKTINTDSQTIELLEFDSESKYIIVATKDGRILQYRYDGSTLLARLYSFNNKKNIQNQLSLVSSFAFEKNIMACGGNCGTIFSINLHSRANKIIIKNDNYRVNSICFLNSSTIVSGNSNGELYFNSLENEKFIKKIETGFRKVTQIILMPIKQYILVVGDTNYIAIYDTKNYKLLHNRYIEFNDNISKIIVADNHSLIVSLQNNTLEKVTLINPEILNSHVQTNKLDKAYALVEQHAMLKTTKEYELLEKIYTEIYDEALEALTKQNKEKALKLTEIFRYTKSKKDEIELLFKAFDNFVRFKNLYIDKKYPLAYAMCTKFPPLKKTFQYKKMEEQWRETFRNAQYQIAHARLDNAKTLLYEYATVTTKRAIIKLILNHNDNFIEFLKAIESKDYQKIEKIAKMNELFTKIPTYQNIEENIQEELKNLQQDVYDCNLDSAIKKINKLQNIDAIETEIEQFKKDCKAIKKLQDAYDENNFIKCYEILDKNNFLNSTELGSLLQKHWFKIISKCEEFALRGNIKDIKITLGELISLSTRRDKIGDLLRVSFHTRIKGLVLQKELKKAENIIYSYIDIFGIDNEIIQIMRYFESITKTKLAITQNSRQDRDNWINSEIIMGN